MGVSILIENILLQRRVVIGLHDNSVWGCLSSKAYVYSIQYTIFCYLSFRLREENMSSDIINHLLPTLRKLFCNITVVLVVVK